MRKNEIAQLQIDDLAFGGRGVAKDDGKVIFVDGGLPGDTVMARITRVKPDYCESRVAEIITPSPHRLKAPCQHFDICGGCKWQDYNYDRQLKYKHEQLHSSLVHIAKFVDPPVEPAIAARKIFFYRNKMEFSFNREGDSGLSLGLHQARSFDRVFNIDKCLLQSEISNKIVAFVRDECRRLNLPAYGIRDHQGLLRFLVIREGKFTGEIMVNLVTGAEYEAYEEQMMQLGKNVASEFPEINSLLWTINSRKANIARWDMYPAHLKSGVLHGRDHIHEKLNQYRFRISPDSFFQTNSYQAQIIYDTIIEYAGVDSQDIIYDLYCGTGTIAIYISALAGKIIGVETVRNAIEDARYNAELNGLKNLEFQAANVEDFMAEAASCDKIIIDPPRAGLHPKTLRGILNLRPSVIVYVSCNPATLARDLAGFVEGGAYALERAVAIDMFPHTYHIESVARLARK